MTIYTSNALRPVAGNQYVPDSMEARGKIKPINPTTGVRNGTGNLVVSGLWAYDWDFPYMLKSEMNWWASLIGYLPLSGIYSKSFATTGSGASTMYAARLWVDDASLLAFKSAVIDMPKWNAYRNGMFLDVVVHFSYMIMDGP